MNQSMLMVASQLKATTMLAHTHQPLSVDSQLAET